MTDTMVKVGLEPRIHQLTVEQVHIEADVLALKNRAQEKPENMLAQLLQLVESIVSEQDTKTLKSTYQVFIESVTLDGKRS